MKTICGMDGDPLNSRFDDKSTMNQSQAVEVWCSKWSLSHCAATIQLQLAKICKNYGNYGFTVA